MHHRSSHLWTGLNRFSFLICFVSLVLGAFFSPIASFSASPAPDVAHLVEARDVEGLRALGPPAIEELVALYPTGNEDQRAEIAWLFYRLGIPSEAARDVLMRDVRSNHRNLRIQVQYALGRVSNDDAVVDALFENMQRGETHLFRDKAACSLAYDQIHLTERQRLHLLKRLIHTLSDPSPEQRNLAIRVLKVQTGQRRGYDAAASIDQRRLSIEGWWRWWHEYRTELERSEAIE